MINESKIDDIRRLLDVARDLLSMTRSREQVSNAKTIVEIALAYLKVEAGDIEGTFEERLSEMIIEGHVNHGGKAAVVLSYPDDLPHPLAWVEGSPTDEELDQMIMWLSNERLGGAE